MPNPYLTQPLVRRRATLIGIYLAFAVVIADATANSTLIGVALAELGNTKYYALTTAVGGVLGVVVVPLLGYLSARNPHWRPYLLAGALSIEVAALAVRGFAPNVWWVIAGGAFLSIGTGGCYVLGLPLIRSMFPIRRAAILLGIVGTASSVGQIVGPLSIGRVIDMWGWRSVSAITGTGLAVAVVLVLAGAKVTRAEGEQIAEADGKFDVLGGVLLAAFVTCLVLPLSLSNGDLPYGSTKSNLLFGGAVLAAIGFALVVAKKKDAAFVSCEVFKDRNSLALTIQTFLSTGSSILVVAFVPLYVLYVLGGTAFEAGVASALFAVPGFFIAPLLGRWIGRTGSAAGVIYASTAFKVVVMVGLGLMMLKTPENVHLSTIYIAMLLAGFYNAGGTVTVQTAPQIMLSQRMRAQGTATVSMMLTLGPITGIAALGGLLTSRGPQEGIAVALLAASAAAALALVPVLFFRSIDNTDAIEAAEEATEALAELDVHDRPRVEVAGA